MTTTIYGSSDDLIEIEGDIEEEFTAMSDDGQYLAFSDGTVLHIEYGPGHSAMWRIRPVVNGSCQLVITQVTEDDPDCYTDRAVLSGEQIKWVVMGTSCAVPKGQSYVLI